MSRGPHLAHGLGQELVPADWPALTSGEVQAVLACYPGLDRDPLSSHIVSWHSPRPMSAAALIRSPAGQLFIKRHHVAVRSVAQLAVEHAFGDHLRARGVPVPAVLRGRDGATARRIGDFAYEVHQVADGLDLYRDAVSWSPYMSLRHARAAGAALARLHLAAAGFPLPARPPAALLTSCDVVLAADPLAAVARLATRLPGLGRYLQERSWRDDLGRHVLPLLQRAAAPLAALTRPGGPAGGDHQRGRQWGHGDWHPSNLTWTSRAPGADVAAVLDLGLANRTLAVHDLATALERATVPWLDLAESGPVEADLDAIDALLDGYESVRPLTRREAAALPEVLAVVHVDYALSEIEYFRDVTRSPRDANLAYDGYLIGHARWFAGPQGTAALRHLRHRATEPSGTARFPRTAASPPAGPSAARLPAARRAHPA